VSLRPVAFSRAGLAKALQQLPGLAKLKLGSPSDHGVSTTRVDGSWRLHACRGVPPGPAAALLRDLRTASSPPSSASSSPSSSAGRSRMVSGALRLTLAGNDATLEEYGALGREMALWGGAGLRLSAECRKERYEAAVGALLWGAAAGAPTQGGTAGGLAGGSAGGGAAGALTEGGGAGCGAACSLTELRVDPWVGGDALVRSLLG
jgi:hypothetical protein